METPASPLLHWLLQQHPDTPKSRAKQWIQAGRVSVNGAILRQPHQLIADPGATLKLGGSQTHTLECGPGWQIHPRVALLYLDSAVAIVNKSPGIISVPSPQSGLSALSILADFLAGKSNARDRSVPGRSVPPACRRLQPLPVHRLDQDTSGVFCMATNPAARAHLIEQLKVHTMRREYVAFVEGRAKSAQGTWRQWLQLSKDELRQHVLAGASAGVSGAQEAITHYEVVAEYPLRGGHGWVTKLRLRLETGRKHQIRAQAAHAGLPLIGDRTYNPAWRGENPHPPFAFPRQALHAEVLNLEHPDQPGRRLTWTAELPKEFRHLEAALRSARL